jgi:hypothetical protein
VIEVHGNLDALQCSRCDYRSAGSSLDRRSSATRKPTIRIVPSSPGHADGAVAVVRPIRQAEFGIPITLDAQPHHLATPAFAATRGRSG